MIVRTALAALALTACGTEYSTDYGHSVDAGRREGSPSPDVFAPPVDAVSIDDARPSDDAATSSDVGTPIEPPPETHGAPYPIVLHHGFAGFRQIGPINYFYNVASDLRAHGETVVEAEVSPFDSPATRAAELATQIDQTLATTHSAKVVLVAHSQGGLDARYLISHLGYGDRIALLATVATPHRGTRVADAVLGLTGDVPSGVLDALGDAIGWTVNDVRTNANLNAAFTGLSAAAAPAFNASNPDDPRVVYWSWAGRSNERTGDVQCAGAETENDPRHVDLTNPLLYAFDLYLEQGDPVAHVNDGLVEVQSARWGVWMGCVPADHFDEIGQIAQAGPVPDSGFDHIAFYRDVVRRVREAGF